MSVTSVDFTFTLNHEFPVSNRFARWRFKSNGSFGIYVTMTDIPIIFGVIFSVLCDNSDKKNVSQL